MFHLHLDIPTPFRLQFSFDHLLVELEKQAANPSATGSEAAAQLLQKVSAFPELRDGITDSAVLQNNKDLLRQLLADYFPAALTNNEIKAVGIPFIGELFNLTHRFQKILQAAGPDFDINIRNFNEHQFYVLNCCLIMQDVYGIHLDFSRPLFYDIPTANGIIKHYRILYNADFLEILPTEKSKYLTPAEIDVLQDNYDDLAL